MKILRLILFLSFISIFPQNGGEELYSFLNISTSAKQAACGGSTLNLTDDVNQPFWNPATLNSNLNQNIALNYVNFLADINYFSAGYAYHLSDRSGSIHGGLVYNNYGKFIAADEEGTETGSFKAFDMALSMGYAYQIPRTEIHVGTNLKLIHSTIEKYNSMGIAADFGFLYNPENELYTIGLVVRNLGRQIVTYDGNLEKIPLNIQAGWTYKLEHVPIKMHFTLDNLQKWQLAYSNPSDNTEDIQTGEIVEKEPSFLNNAFRHFVVGAEIFPDKGFSLRAGYNFQRAQELKINDKRTFAGLSFGFGLKVRKLKLNYAFTKYHPVANSHNFSLGINLN